MSELFPDEQPPFLDPEQKRFIRLNQIMIGHVASAMKAGDDEERAKSIFAAWEEFVGMYNDPTVPTEEMFINELHLAWWYIKTNCKGETFNRMLDDEVMKIPPRRPRTKRSAY